jgi:ribosomal protein S18 acetylase RimI-like enzyme
MHHIEISSPSVVTVPKPFFIRLMRIEDHTAVFDLWQRSEGVGLSAADDRAGVAAYLERNPGMSAVAVGAAEPSPRTPPGMVAVLGAVLCGHDGRRGFLYHLAVEPAYRRRGVARALVRWCTEHLSAAGIEKCNIMLRTGNDEGESFWLANGWATRRDLMMMQKPIARN